MDLKNAFTDELSDVLHAERQLVKALPRFAKAVTSDQLRQALESHLEQTQEQIGRLEQVFGTVSKKVVAKKCTGMEGILAEANRILQQAGKKSKTAKKQSEESSSTEGSSTTSSESTTASEEQAEPEESGVDAAIIGAAQKVEHYEIATYGTLCAWAKSLQNQEAAQLLGQTLEEEKAADQKLTQIAEGLINPNASDEQQQAGMTESRQGREEFGTQDRSGRRYQSETSRGRVTATKKGQEYMPRSSDWENEDRGGSSRRGFAAMDPEERREIAARGGRASHGGRGRDYEEDDDYESRSSRGRSSRYEDEDEDYERGGGSSRRGFASMDPERQREIASMGGRASRGGFKSMDPEEHREVSARGGRHSHGGHGRDWEDEGEDYESRSSRGRSSRYEDEDEDYERGGGRSRRGFAAMDPERQREIASRGGRASHRND